MSVFRPYWWTRAGDDGQADQVEQDPRHLASTGSPIRRAPDHEPHPRRLAAQPPWVRVAVAVVLMVGLVRLIGSVGAWESCGAEPGQAWMLAVQGLGAKPTALECLGISLDQQTTDTTIP